MRQSRFFRPPGTIFSETPYLRSCQSPRCSLLMILTFFFVQAHNETTICFMPRTTQVPDEAVILGETVFAGQGGATRNAADSPAKVPNESVKSSSLEVAAGSSIVQSGNVSEKVVNESPSAAQPSPVHADVDLNSWSAMSSQKRSKVFFYLLIYFHIAFLLLILRRRSKPFYGASLANGPLLRSPKREAAHPASSLCPPLLFLKTS